MKIIDLLNKGVDKENPISIPYIIAENNYIGSEFAGACFSPVGTTLFVNLQSNGQTIAIKGNWSELTS